MSVNTAHSVVAGPQVDVRGPRFVAWVTTAVLIVTLLVSTVSVPAAAVILGLQDGACSPSARWRWAAPASVQHGCAQRSSPRGWAR